MKLPQGERVQGDKVIGLTKDLYADTVGRYNENPLLNSMLYEVELTDVKIK